MASLLLVSIMLQAALAESSITCFQDDLKCQVSNGNLIEMHVETTWQECSLLCQNDPACMAFNFFGPDSNFHPQNACLLFSGCEEKVPFEDCLLGTKEQPCTCTSEKACPCSIEFEGTVDNDNFVDIAAEVQSEDVCKSLCSEAPDCAVYTYYNNQDLYQPGMCMMLSSSGMLKSASKCANCKTGPVTCQAGQRCQAAVLTDGATFQHVFAQSSTTATLISAEKDCFLDVRALAIGGGGSGARGGGGGSGQIDFGILQLWANGTLNLVVGKSNENSLVIGLTKGSSEGQVLLTGAAGGENYGGNGGDGYCGGGAGSTSYDGGQAGGEDGSDGGDDKDFAGGKGSGLDVRTLNMTRFILTPGKGGKPDGSDGGGGGGILFCFNSFLILFFSGGILVNGEKPEGCHFGECHFGEGFGGGGSWQIASDNNGFPGCILIEV